MKAIQKVSLSLLLAVVVFSLFAIVAFSGLFQVIQTNFYDARVRAVLTANLTAVRNAVDTFNRDNFRRFQAILTDGSVRRIYSPNQSSDDIFARANLFQKLSADYPGLLFVRFIDANGNIHFSTLPSDILQKGTYEITYKTLAAADKSLPPKELELAGPADERVLESEGRFIYRLPAFDSQGERRGTALFYVASGALTQYLVRQSLLSAGQSITLLPGGILYNLDAGSEPALGAAVSKAWQSEAAPTEAQPVVADSSGQQLLLFTAQSTSAGLVGTLVPRSEFTLSPSLRILLSGSIFIATFLIAFFILNLRQDRMLILSDRIKRFQIAFLKGYLEERQELDWARWYNELEQRGLEVKREIKRGIGSLTKERDREVDELIDKSWTDILSVIGKRVERDRLAQVEVKGLEETIRRVLASAELKLPARGPLPAIPGVSESRTGPEGGRAESLPGGPQGAARPAPDSSTAAVTEEAEELAELEAVEEVGAVEEGGGAAAGGEQPTRASAPETAAERVEQSAIVPPVEELGELEEVGELEPIEPEGGAVFAAEDEEVFDLLPVEEGESATEPLPTADLPGAPAADGLAELMTPEQEPASEAIPAEEGPEAGGAIEPQSAPGDGEGLGAQPPQGAPAGMDDFADLGLTESDILPVGREGGDDEAAELEPVEEVESGGFSVAREDHHYTWDALEEVEALDLEAIFHGEELLADIDIFEEPANEPPPADERADSAVESLVAVEAQSPDTEEVEELLTVREAPSGEASLERVSPTFALLRGFRRFVTSPAARRLPEEQSASLIEEGAQSAAPDGGRADGADEAVEELPAAEEEPAPEAAGETGPAAEPAGEVAEGVAEVEEIGVLEEEPAQARTSEAASLGSGRFQATPSGGAFDQQLQLLISRGLVEVCALSGQSRPEQPLQRDNGADAVGVRDGLFQVREELIRGSARTPDEGFSSLVESVVSGPGPGRTSGEGSSGGYIQTLPIDGLISRARGLRSAPEARGRPLASEPQKLLSEEGLSYDAVRAQFLSSNLGVTKSLMRASQNADAIYAAILLPREGGLSTQFSLGLDERNAAALAFSSDDPVYRSLLALRRVVYLRVPVVGIPSFDEKLSPKDVRFVKGSLYLPVIYDGKPGYLFFGLKDSSPPVEDYIARVLSMVL